MANFIQAETGQSGLTVTFYVYPLGSVTALAEIAASERNGAGVYVAAIDSALAGQPRGYYACDALGTSSSLALGSQLVAWDGLQIVGPALLDPWGRAIPVDGSNVSISPTGSAGAAATMTLAFAVAPTSGSITLNYAPGSLQVTFNAGDLASVVQNELNTAGIPWNLTSGDMTGTSLTFEAQSNGAFGSDPWSVGSSNLGGASQSDGGTWTGTGGASPSSGFIFIGDEVCEINPVDASAVDHTANFASMMTAISDSWTIADDGAGGGGGSEGSWSGTDALQDAISPSLYFNSSALFEVSTSDGNNVTFSVTWIPAAGGSISSFTDGQSAYTLSVTDAYSGAWLLGYNGAGAWQTVAYNANAAAIDAALSAQNWSPASVSYASGSGDGSPNAVYTITLDTGITAEPTLAIGTLANPFEPASDPRLADLDAAVSSRAAPGDQMDLVDAPNATAITAFVAAIWRGLIASYNGVANSFGWLFSTKLAGISGQVAAQSDVATIQNNTTISLSLPPAIQIPATGSIAYPVTIYLRDSEGVMVNANSTPTVTVVDPLGNNYGSRLSAVSNPTTGKYTLTATIESTDTEVLLIWEVTATTSEGTQIIGGQSWVTQQVLAYFTTTDRSTLDSLAAQVGEAGAGLTALPPVSLTSETHVAIADDVQTGLTSQGYTSTRAGFLDTLNGLVAAVWGVATGSLTSGVGQRMLAFFGAGNYSAPPSADAIAAAVLADPDNPLATDSLGRVTVSSSLVGAGSVAWPVTIALASGDPLGNVLVTITSDEAGETVVAGPVATDSNGRVVFSLDPGEYYRWATGVGISFSNPQSFTVSAP